MKIKSIELQNIGLYKKQKMDFSCDEKTVYLIWGNNGAGKTTLLNSIKVGLLGSKAFGLDYAEYCSFVRDKLISTRLDSSKIKASISICLQINEQNELIDYKIERKFKVENGVLEETFEIYKNDFPLDFFSKEQVLNRIETSIPPSLLDVIIFDGESAINILDKDEMHKLVRNIIFAIFGMDVYYNLAKDLAIYLKNMIITENNSSDDQVNLIALESKYKECNLELNTTAASLDTYKKEKAFLLSNINALIKKISNKTGIDFNEIINVKQELQSLQSHKKQLDDEIKYINEEILPLKLLHLKIQELIIQLEAEKPHMILNSLNSLKSFFNSDPDALSLLENLGRKINVGKETEVIHNFSETDLKTIQRIDELLCSFSKEKLKTYYSSKNTAFAMLKEKTDAIEKLNDEESKEIVANIENLYSKLISLENNIQLLLSNLEEKEKCLNEIKTEYDCLKKKLTAQKKGSNSYISIQLYKDAVETFISENIQDICKKLSESVLQQLKKIHFRNGSISKVFISPKNYEVHLYEESGKLIPSKLFSAGEKQILLGLVLKESISLSKIDTFFLFDTPVGRLDMKNRKIFTEEVIFKVSDQSIVFATDSDYSKNDYKEIKSKLTEEYKLIRNSKDQIAFSKGSIY